ncbi:hypothetical protein MTO96_023946 [Rhipicephalus appendiculatus]
MRVYVTTVKAYEQRAGANIVRGKMSMESLPTNRSVSPTGMLPGMVPGMTLPRMECVYNMGMCMGAGGPCGYGHQMPLGGVYGASLLSFQRSREDVKNMMNSGGGVDFARMAEMGPRVRRLLDMGSQTDQIMDMTKRTEGSPIIMGLDSAGGYGGPATCFGGPPPMMVGSGFDMPMPGGDGGPTMPPYGAPMPGMARDIAEPFQEGYGRP